MLGAFSMLKTKGAVVNKIDKCLIRKALDSVREMDGGKGSGNHGHKGRPGQRGGSSPSGAGQSGYSSGTKGKTRAKSSADVVALVAGEKNYMRSPKYQELRKKRIAATQEIDALKKEWSDLNGQLKQEILDTPEVRELGRQYADLFDAYTDKGKAIKKRMKEIRERLKQGEAQEQRYKGQLDAIRAEERRREQAEFSPQPLKRASGDDYEGFTTETDVPYIRELLDRGEAWIAEMSPKEYLERCTFEIFHDSSLESTVAAVDFENANKYADQMESGERFAVPYLNFRSRNQEGRHRAVAAMLNGYTKIPVVIIGKGLGGESI